MDAPLPVIWIYLASNFLTPKGCKSLTSKADLSSFSRFEIISYTVAAIARFEQLKRMRLGVRAPDLRIAAIVLEHSGGILVTRNIRDFKLVLGLAIADWPKP